MRPTYQKTVFLIYKDHFVMLTIIIIYKWIVNWTEKM